MSVGEEALRFIARRELRVRCDGVVDVDTDVFVAHVARDGFVVGAFGAVTERMVAVLVRAEVSGWAGNGVVDDGEAEAAADGELLVVARHGMADGQREEVIGAFRGCEGYARAEALGFFL